MGEREGERERDVDEKGFPSVILKQSKQHPKTTTQWNPTANSDVTLSVFSSVLFPSPRKISLFLYCVFAFKKVQFSAITFCLITPSPTFPISRKASRNRKEKLGSNGVKRKNHFSVHKRREREKFVLSHIMGSRPSPDFYNYSDMIDSLINF